MALLSPNRFTISESQEKSHWKFEGFRQRVASNDHPVCHTATTVLDPDLAGYDRQSGCPLLTETDNRGSHSGRSAFRPNTVLLFSEKNSQKGAADFSNFSHCMFYVC